MNAALRVPSRNLAGETTLAEQERAWSFVPAQPWRPGRHHLVVSTTIEALAGNHIGKVFDVDVLEDHRADTAADDRRHGVRDALHRREGSKHRGREAGPRVEPQDCLRHYGERSLRSSQQGAERVSGVVLHQARQPPDDRAVGEHGLHPDKLLAHAAIAQDVHAPGVGRDHAAHGRGVSRSHVHAEVPSAAPDVLLEDREGQATPDRDFAGDLVGGERISWSKRLGDERHQLG